MEGIITGIRNRDLCKDYFKRLKILPLQSQYLLSILMFVVQNMKQFKSNTEVLTNNTKHCTDLHLQFSRLSTYLRRTAYMGIRIFN